MKHTMQDTFKANQLKNAELWYQDPEDSNLWHGKHGVIVNTAALNEREFYYTVVRIASKPFYQAEQLTRVYA
jgi:hypothetical protein